MWLPGAAFLDLALEAATTLADGGEVQLADVRFVQPLRLDADRPVRLQMVLRPAEDGFRDSPSRRRLPVSVGGTARDRADRPHRGSVGGRGGTRRPARALRRAGRPSALYAGLAALGIDYGPAFRGLTEGHRDGGTTAVARLAARPAAGHLLHPATLDAAFHTAALPAAARRAGRSCPPAPDAYGSPACAPHPPG
ncbi:polyketide synthase dehydratase domain-containing protein [Streptomyces diastatochromogenes]|nr:polyketide synthase dehydratase domain-containing protein [Streptomyces diastatochromogenes]